MNNSQKLRQVIGLHSAREVLKVRPKAVQEIWLKQGAERSHDLIYFADWAKNNRVKLQLKPEGALDKVAASHQGVCILVSETPSIDLEHISETGSMILLALDEVTDPHNVGAALRTAWLLGAEALLVPENRSAHLTPASIKVASGGAEHVPLLVVKNLADELKCLKDKGFWIYGLSGDARHEIWKTKFHERVVLVVGAEDKGLRASTIKACDELVAIPQVEKSASFNASAAVSMALYEVVRQHKNP